MRIRNDKRSSDKTQSTDHPGGAPMDDAAEFRAAIGPVRRLPEVDAVPRASRPQAVAAMHLADERAALAESQRGDPLHDADSIGDSIAWRRDEVSPQTLRRLKRVEFAIEDEIDLHLLGERAAEDLLRRFLAEARDAAHHCVRIIHGKGLHSPQGPVLKGLVERVLNQRAEVLAYASPPAAHGGTGAVLVLLAKRRPTEQRLDRSRSGSREN
jgi:DNA-nicking Smr family endonuclease